MKKLTLRAVVSEGAGMRYNKTIMLSNGVECCLRNGIESDGQLVLDNFNLTHSETDYLLHIQMKTVLMPNRKAGS